MEVEESIEKLKQYRLDGRCRYGVSTMLCMVMYDLEQVMLSILEDHEDTLVFQDGFNQMDDIWVRQFRAQSHFTAR